MKPTDILGNIKLYNADCMEVMKTFKDKQFGLAIIDPPYKNEFNITANEKAAKVKKHYDLNSLNNSKPTNEYFNEIKRVSKNQIIWGVNYYDYYLGAGRIVWDKDNTGVYSDCELAYQSFSDVTRKFQWRWNGMLQQNMKNKEDRIHPTQKPVQLYKWLLKNYAEEGDTILDTHFGSLSIGIACHDMKFDLTAIELDKDYYEQAKQRLIYHQRQLTLF